MLNRRCLEAFTEKLLTLPSSPTKSELLVSPFVFIKKTGLASTIHLIMNISIGLPQ